MNFDVCSIFILNSEFDFKKQKNFDSKIIFNLFSAL